MAQKYFYNITTDYEGKFVDIQAYPSEIEHIYLTEEEFADYLAHEDQADQLQQEANRK